MHFPLEVIHIELAVHHSATLVSVGGFNAKEASSGSRDSTGFQLGFTRHLFGFLPITQN